MRRQKLEDRRQTRIGLVRSKAVISFTALIVGLLFSFAALKSETPAIPSSPKDFPITICGAAFSDELAFSSPVSIIEGLGDLHYRISTRDTLAQKFFDQGLKLVYGFNHVEALRAFKEASRLDPSCAMAWWGQALTLGPNINDWNPKDREAMAFETINKAKKLGIKSTQKERDLILAMSARYDGKAYDNRDQLNFAYRDAMEKLSKKYPADPEALVLYADAIMTSMPWDYWNKDGSPKAQTTSARAALELAMKKHPRHPGAHHMYIHLVEASSKPGDARKSAEFLETAMPSAGHIVHMPSHIYARIGEYQRSNNSNRMAIKADETFLSGSDDQGLYRLGYYPHNIDFLHFGALMTGESAVALAEGNKLSFHVKPLQTSLPAYYDYYSPAPIVAMVRYGKWNDILAMPLPDDRYYTSAAIHRFARGMAFLRTNAVENAQSELKILESINKLDTIKTIYAFFNSVNQITDVATKILSGEVLIAQKKLEEGLKQLTAAVQAEDDLRYNEPSDWRLPARHYLGAALIDAGRFEEARKVYLEDLRINPENGWGLIGLSNSYQKMGNNSEAAQTNKRFADVWKNADIKISSSRF